jgi:cobalt-zinc-cadmium efflux system membrane fusion protein
VTKSRALIAEFLIAASGLLLTGCGTSTTPAAEAEPIRNPLEITPNSDLRKDIAVGNARWEPVSVALRVAGRVEADGTRLARVSAPVTGRIVEMNVVEGENVRKGQVLATVYSTELSSAQSDYLKAMTEQQVLERGVSRARQLLEAGVIGSAELHRREAELQQAGADVAAAREQLRVLGLMPEEIESLKKNRGVSSVTHIYSTIDGTVLERKATAGQVVEAVAPVFVIADLSRVWLVADVPEQSAGNLAIGKEVQAEIPALPGHKITGRLSFVSATVDPETRTIRTRMELPNPDRLFKPAMLTNMTLVDDSARRLVVPASAVVRNGNSDAVFVQTAPDSFMLRTVSVGDELGDVRVVRDGLREDETIVVEGAFHLNNERKRLLTGGEDS